MVRGFPKRAGTVINFIGAEVTWEILKTDNGWFVRASHHGEGDDTFKFESAGPNLDAAVSIVGRLCWRNGPDWIKTYDKSGRHRKVRI